MALLLTASTATGSSGGGFDLLQLLLQATGAMRLVRSLLVRLSIV